MHSREARQGTRSAGHGVVGMSADVSDRMKQYIAEQTALPLDTIEAVLSAQERFWTQYRRDAEEARELLDLLDDE